MTAEIASDCHAFPTYPYRVQRQNVAKLACVVQLCRCASLDPAGDAVFGGYVRSENPRAANNMPAPLADLQPGVAILLVHPYRISIERLRLAQRAAPDHYGRGDYPISFT